MRNMPCDVASTTAAGGVAPIVTLNISGMTNRVVFDTPSNSVYTWIVYDTRGKPVDGRVDQVGGMVLPIRMPVKEGFTLQYTGAGLANGLHEATFWLDD